MLYRIHERCTFNTVLLCMQSYTSAVSPTHFARFLDNSPAGHKQRRPGVSPPPTTPPQHQWMLVGSYLCESAKHTGTQRNAAIAFADTPVPSTVSIVSKYKCSSNAHVPPL